MSHKQLTQEQRDQSYALKKAGVENTEIADILQFHKSTICREIKRNTSRRGSRPKQAHIIAMSRKRNSVQTRIFHGQCCLSKNSLKKTRALKNYT